MSKAFCVITCNQGGDVRSFISEHLRKGLRQLSGNDRLEIRLTSLLKINMYNVTHCGESSFTVRETGDGEERYPSSVSRRVASDTNDR